MGDKKIFLLQFITPKMMKRKMNQFIEIEIILQFKFVL